MENRNQGGIWFFTVLCCLLTFSPQAKLRLTVNIKGATPNEGQAIVALFSSADTYLKEPLVNKTKPINDKGEVTFQMDHLAIGT